MNVFDFVELCCDPGLLTVRLFDLDSGEDVWTGYGDEIPEKYGYLPVGSFDCPDKEGEITINVQSQTEMED